MSNSRQSSMSEDKHSANATEQWRTSRRHSAHIAFTPRISENSDCFILTMWFESGGTQRNVHGRPTHSHSDWRRQRHSAHTHTKPTSILSYLTERAASGSDKVCVTQSNRDQIFFLHQLGNQKHKKEKQN